MNPVTEFGLLAALAHHPRLVAAVVGLMLLLFAEPIHAASRGSAQNPILIPGTQTTSPRIVAHARRDRVMLHRGAFEATLYSLPALAVPRGTRVCLSQDTHAAGAAALAEFDAAQAGAVDLGGTGLKLSVDPSWDVEVEGHGVALGEMASAGSAARTRGRFPHTLVGLEVRF